MITWLYYLYISTLELITRLFYPMTEKVEGRKNYYELSFNHKQQEYIYRFQHKRIPSSILAAYSQGENVKDELTKFMGPRQDFFGLNPTPADLGMNDLEIVFSDLHTLTFDQNESISI